MRYRGGLFSTEGFSACGGIQGPPPHAKGIQGPPLYGKRVQGPPLNGKGIQGPPLYGKWIQGPPLYGKGIQGLPLHGRGSHISGFCSPADVTVPGHGPTRPVPPTGRLRDSTLDSPDKETAFQLCPILRR